MAKTKPACDGDTLLLDQMSCLIDWIGGCVVASAALRALGPISSHV
jgi:hypothetical protein